MVFEVIGVVVPDVIEIDDGRGVMALLGGATGRRTRRVCCSGVCSKVLADSDTALGIGL